MAEGRADSGDRVSSIRAGRIDAVFDEGIMSETWKDIADTVDLEFLPINKDVLDSLERKYGMSRSVLNKGRLRGLKQETRTLPLPGWLIYHRIEQPNEAGYYYVCGRAGSKTHRSHVFRHQRH